MRFATETDRVEAFSDGVFAVLITIMVLELRPPNGLDLAAIVPALPSIAIYALSFVLVAIYWNNHHHMLRASVGIDGRAMWANMNLLFWLSLVPFATAWLGRNPTAVGPTVVYTLILLCSGISYAILQVFLMQVNGPESPFTKALSRDWKGTLPSILYTLAIIAAFFSTYISDALIVSVSVLWFFPDKRLEPLINMNREEQ